MRKTTIWVPTWSDTTQAEQAQKMAGGLKFWIKKVEELYCPCSENKGADQLRSYCAFVFAYADGSFSQANAHLFI